MHKTERERGQCMDKTETDRQTDRQTDTDTKRDNRETDRQTDRETEDNAWRKQAKNHAR